MSDIRALTSTMTKLISAKDASKGMRCDGQGELPVWERGPKVDQQLQKLMKQLGDAINDTLSDSDQIAEVISRIKSGGYDVFLVLEATIGFNRRDEYDS